MALINQYVNTNIQNGKLASAALFSGEYQKSIIANVSIASSDDDNSNFRLGRVSASMIPTSFVLRNSAITGGSNYQIRVYSTLDSGLSNLTTLSGTITMVSSRGFQGAISGTCISDIANIGKPLYELMGQTAGDNEGEYDICLVAPVIGSVAGTVALEINFLQY